MEIESSLVYDAWPPRLLLGLPLQSLAGRSETMWGIPGNIRRKLGRIGDSHRSV